MSLGEIFDRLDENGDGVYEPVSEFFNEVDVDAERAIRRAEAVEGAIAAVVVYGMDLDAEDLPEFFKLVRDGLS